MSFVTKEPNSPKLYAEIAEIVVLTIKENPESVIFLSTGIISIRFYQALVEYFKENIDFDLSNASFYQIDEYVGLEAGHPISHAHFMDVYFYKPLIAFDPQRAPKNIYKPEVLPGETPQDAAERYAKMIANIEEIDLAILVAGPTYVEDGEVKGGHIGFNYPGTPIDKHVHVATLTERLKLDLMAAFESLVSLIESGEVDNHFSTDMPSQAITMGFADIMRVRHIAVIATGDACQATAALAIGARISPWFFATNLNRHQYVRWYLDYDSYPPPRLANPFRNPYAPEIFADFVCYNQKVLVVAPEPGVDMIGLYATIRQMLINGNDVYMLYVTSGHRAVRRTDKAFKELYPQLKEKYSTLLPHELDRLVKGRVRQIETEKVLSGLGIQPDHQIFFRAQYYNRMYIPGIEPFDPKDLTKMIDLVNKIQPSVVFFTSQNDLHGVHGLSAKLMAQALQISNLKPKLYGYRSGASEWSFNLRFLITIVPFEADWMEDKITAIKGHRSILHPLFPSGDLRIFWKRAYYRNQQSGKFFSRSFCELFKQFVAEDFFKKYA